MTRRESDPLALFRQVFDQASSLAIDDPNAMALSTVGSDGRPSTRMVLLKSFDERGFVFYTNLGSRKALEIRQNPAVSLHFFWRELERQVLIEGVAEAVEEAEADEYFASRPRQSQLGAWASRQSQALPGRGRLLKDVAKFELQFLTRPVPRPPFWSGFRVVADRYEFWKSGPFRLHERQRFEKTVDGWTSCHLFP